MLVVFLQVYQYYWVICAAVNLQNFLGSILYSILIFGTAVALKWFNVKRDQAILYECLEWVQTKLSPLVFAHYVNLIEVCLMIDTMSQHVLLTKGYVFYFSYVSMQANGVMAHMRAYIFFFKLDIVKVVQIFPNLIWYHFANFRIFFIIFSWFLRFFRYLQELMIHGSPSLLTLCNQIS